MTTDNLDCYELTTYDGKKIVYSREKWLKIAKATDMIKATDEFGVTHYINPSSMASASQHRLTIEEQRRIKRIKDGNGGVKF